MELSFFDNTDLSVIISLQFHYKTKFMSNIHTTRKCFRDHTNCFTGKKKKLRNYYDTTTRI